MALHRAPGAAARALARRQLPCLPQTTTLALSGPRALPSSQSSSSIGWLDSARNRRHSTLRHPSAPPPQAPGVAASPPHYGAPPASPYQHGHGYAHPPPSAQMQMHGQAHQNAGARGQQQQQQDSSNGGALSAVKKFVVILLKTTLLYTPAVIMWLSVLSGVQLLDFRSDEEVAEDENEARRLERFFDVETLSELEYLPEWTTKEQALTKIVEKLLRSQQLVDRLVNGPQQQSQGASSSAWTDHEAPTSEFELQKSKTQSKEIDAFLDEALKGSVEVSYVLPPTWEYSDEDSKPGRLWEPVIVLKHRSGGIALVHLAFQHVKKRKDREAFWACTELICDVVASPSRDFGAERLCELTGAPPHGVQYMRMGEAQAS